MRRGVREGPPVALEALAKRLEAYRGKRSLQGRLPERLWTQAAKLALQHGVGRVQRVLRLNYYGLKQRMEALPAPDLEPVLGMPKSPHPAFVEMMVPPIAPALPGTVSLEVEDRTGRKLTVRLPTEDRRELLALARALWGCAP